jgi:hypothetical protein
MVIGVIYTTITIIMDIGHNQYVAFHILVY